MKLYEKIGYVLGKLMGAAFYLLSFAIVLAVIKLAIMLIKFCLAR